MRNADQKPGLIFKKSVKYEDNILLTKCRLYTYCYVVFSIGGDI